MIFKTHDRNWQEMPSYLIPKRRYYKGDHKSSNRCWVVRNQPRWPGDRKYWFELSAWMKQGINKTSQSRCGNHFPSLELIGGYQKLSDDQYGKWNHRLPGGMGASGLRSSAALNSEARRWGTIVAGRLCWEVGYANLLTAEMRLDTNEYR
jgi:hypothetical protein